MLLSVWVYHINLLGGINEMNIRILQNWNIKLCAKYVISVSISYITSGCLLKSFLTIFWGSSSPFLSLPTAHSWLGLLATRIFVVDKCTSHVEPLWDSLQFYLMQQVMKQQASFFRNFLKLFDCRCNNNIGTISILI